MPKMTSKINMHVENWEQISTEAWWYLVHKQLFEPRKSIEDEENLKIMSKRQKTSQKKKHERCTSVWEPLKQSQTW